MGVSIVIGLNASNSRATTSTEPFARNTHQRSDNRRERPASEYCVRAAACGMGPARASSDDLVALGVEVIGSRLFRGGQSEFSRTRSRWLGRVLAHPASVIDRRRAMGRRTYPSGADRRPRV